MRCGGWRRRACAGVAPRVRAAGLGGGGVHRGRGPGEVSRCVPGSAYPAPGGSWGAGTGGLSGALRTEHREGDDARAASRGGGWRGRRGQRVPWACRGLPPPPAPRRAAPTFWCPGSAPCPVRSGAGGSRRFRELNRLRGAWPGGRDTAGPCAQLPARWARAWGGEEGDGPRVWHAVGATEKTRPAVSSSRVGSSASPTEPGWTSRNCLRP